MEKHGIDIPDITFNSIEDVAEYLGIALPERVKGYIWQYNEERQNGKISYNNKIGC